MAQRFLKSNILMKSLDHFGLLAPFYEKFIPPRNSEILLDLLSLTEKGILLDAGGGTGRVSRSMIGFTGQIIIADLSIKMLRQINKTDNLRIVNSVVECLPFSSNLFDRIIMVDALHHVISQKDTALELFRVLKPSGKIIIEEPDYRKVIVKLLALAEKITLMRSHFLDPEQIEKLFNFNHSRVSIRENGFNCYIIIDKE